MNLDLLKALMPKEVLENVSNMGKLIAEMHQMQRDTLSSQVVSMKWVEEMTIAMRRMEKMITILYNQNVFLEGDNPNMDHGLDKFGVLRGGK